MGTWINVNKERMESLRCPVGFSEEVIVVFLVKMSQIDTGNDKKTKFFHFSKVFMHFFLRISTDCMDWNVLMGQQGKS